MEFCVGCLFAANYMSARHLGAYWRRNELVHFLSENEFNNPFVAMETGHFNNDGSKE